MLDQAILNLGDEIDPKSPGSPWFALPRRLCSRWWNGLFYHLVRYEGDDWVHYGRFVTMERPARIDHRWVSEATRGLESRIARRFEPEGAGALETLHHSNLPDDEMIHRHRDGWGFVLGAIEQRFKARGA
jgi:hypothetical protein